MYNKTIVVISPLIKICHFVTLYNFQYIYILRERITYMSKKCKSVMKFQIPNGTKFHNLYSLFPLGKWKEV